MPPLLGPVSLATPSGLLVTQLLIVLFPGQLGWVPAQGI